jgi:hypothetical protein
MGLEGMVALAVALASVIGVVVQSIVNYRVNNDREETREARHEQIAAKWLRKNLAREVSWAKLDEIITALGLGEDESVKRYMAVLAGYGPTQDSNVWRR